MFEILLFFSHLMCIVHMLNIVLLFELNRHVLERYVVVRDLP